MHTLLLTGQQSASLHVLCTKFHTRSEELDAAQAAVVRVTRLNGTAEKLTGCRAKTGGCLRTMQPRAAPAGDSICGVGLLRRQAHMQALQRALGRDI